MFDEYTNYGDVNPLEHGGIWVKRINDHEFEIIGNDPKEGLFYDLNIDIIDSWLDKDSVMYYIGMDEETFDPIWFAIGCISYYGPTNFGVEYIYVNNDKLIEFLKCRGIIIKKE